MIAFGQLLALKILRSQNALLIEECHPIDVKNVSLEMNTRWFWHARQYVDRLDGSESQGLLFSPFRIKGHMCTLVVLTLVGRAQSGVKAG
jgi:hypothetical protein